MTAISHHISEPLMVAYAAGNLAEPYALVVATHISMCDECRARMAAHECAGGVLLEGTGGQAVSGDLKDRVLSGLDTEVKEAPVYARSGVFPGPVMAALKGKPPQWKSLGFGVRQQILQSSGKGSVRLLYIPGGQAVPDHSHDGLELTLVLQGAFSDESGRFGVGDLEIADDDVDHAPMAEHGEVCICLAATSAPLRFNSWMPRLFQPLFRI
ncbi:ChrR family anti-sigma-E factor [Cognatishimia sp. 1_MG-2023]|uniref:ChrR family anti-sigma-E factor n=1 Tax=Cognatishimia sp. 1_MG-2023 TaxID=3062642 RepID=UPI0026E1A2C7|nr:ChrR family anti-sigma-E factor [Cognatishimia sp. 1_MG-2023]MDO6727903.1 ChrR family anti-sigma-E factor [Cognatishimia sp. 1_MG-2023]